MSPEHPHQALGRECCLRTLTNLNITRLNAVLLLTVDYEDPLTASGDTAQVKTSGDGGCASSADWLVRTYDKEGALGDAGFVVAMI